MNQFLKCINLILTLHYITGYSFLLFCHIYTWTVSVCVFQILIYSPWMKDIVSVLQTFEYVVLHAFYSYTLLKDFQPGQKLLKLKKVHQHHIKTNDIRMGCHLSSYMCEAR